MTEERIDGPTPNGGAYAITYYQDADGEAAEKDRAVKVEIVEFDTNDNHVWRTYGDIGNEPTE